MARLHGPIAKLEGQHPRPQKLYHSDHCSRTRSVRGAWRGTKSIETRKEHCQADRPSPSADFGRPLGCLYLVILLHEVQNSSPRIVAGLLVVGETAVEEAVR